MKIWKKFFLRKCQPSWGWKESDSFEEPIDPPAPWGWKGPDSFEEPFGPDSFEDSFITDSLEQPLDGPWGWKENESRPPFSMEELMKKWKQWWVASSTSVEYLGPCRRRSDCPRGKGINCENG